jgi:hypothetical protein
MDSETGFLVSHAVASGVKKEDFSAIIEVYAEYQKVKKTYGKLVGELGRTDTVFCEHAFSKYFELEGKLRSVLGENFTKAAKAFKNREESVKKIKEAVNSSELSIDQIRALFPMMEEFL